MAQITPQQMIVNMSRGINVGNVMSAPIEGNWAPEFQETYFQDIADAGFKTVRIPVDFFGSRTTGNTNVYSKSAGTSTNYTGTSADYVVSSTYLDRLEQVITWSLNNGLITILDFHGSTLKSEFLYTFSPKPKWSAYYTDPTSAKRVADNEKFRAIWTAVANRLKDYTYNLLFEVVNEPYFFLTSAEMDILNTDIINIIRNSGNNNTDRNIIITGGGENAHEAPQQIGTALLNNDDNLIATFHYYKPRDFTASSSEDHNDFDWGSTSDKTTIDSRFNEVQTWSQANNTPVFLGEFGADNECGYDYIANICGSDGGPENTSRVEYHSYLAEAAISRGFAFTAWDAGDRANKTIYKVTDRTWVEGVRNALLGNTLVVENIDNSNESIIVYPNPAKNQIFIKINNPLQKVKLFDIKGSEISTQFNSNVITVSNYDEGMYLLRLFFNDGSSHTKKVLLKK